MIESAPYRRNTRTFSASPLMIDILRYLLPLGREHLIWQMARREVLGRYRGSVMGLAWSVVTPLLMMSVYSFVFVGIFRSRWPGMEGGGGVAFALQIFAGLTVFNLFAEVMNRAPRIVLDQPNLVKKVVFPLEILPWVGLLAALFHMLLSLAILIAASALILHNLPLSVVAAPLVLACMVPFLLGMSWILAALGVYLRDVSQIMGPVVTVTMFLSPVFYSLDALSQSMQTWMQLNPLTLIIEQLRRVVVLGEWPQWMLLGLYLAASLGVAVVGAAFFRLTRKGFADVL